MLLTALNVPVIGESTLKARECEIGPIIDEIAKSSCEVNLEEKRKKWEGEGQEGSDRLIGASYHMGRQKRGKGHNSHTGRLIWFCLLCNSSILKAPIKQKDYRKILLKYVFSNPVVTVHVVVLL